MDPREALSSLFPSYEEGSREKQRQADEYVENSSNYRALTAEEGKQVALMALDLYDAGETKGYAPQIILTNIAAVVPGSLKGLYPQLLARDLFWTEGMMFREADPALRDRLIALVEIGTHDPTFHPSYRQNEFLYILAAIGDEVVQATFRKWRDNPPPGLPHPEDVLPETGWELTPGGRRRNLYVAPMQAAAASSPVQIGGILSERCGWCGRSLASFLDLDLTDPRLAALWPQGERLRIPMCLNCSLQYAVGSESVFMDVDGRGLARWSQVNGPPPTFPSRKIWEESNINYIEAFPVQPCVLGARRPTSYERGDSHLGGCPGWLQGNYYPRCPLCKQLMTFFGQYDLRSVNHDKLSAFAYLMAFVCIPCGKATTGYIT